MAIDLPPDVSANFQATAYGSPVVQVAQATQAGCNAPAASGTQRYKIGNTGNTLVVENNKSGKPAYSLVKADGTSSPLKVNVAVPSTMVTIVTFTDNSILTQFHMKDSKGQNMASTFKDAQGKTHALIEPKPQAAAPGCTVS